MKKKEIKRLSIKDIGDIASFEGTSANRDSFNIFSKSAFFDYDTAKEISKYCLIVGKNSSKYIAKKPPKNTPTTLDGNYGLKKKRIFTIDDWYMEEIGNSISIKKINIPNIGEGIAYAPSFELFGGNAWWLNNSFFKNYIKLTKNNLHSYIDVNDNKLCFGLFNAQWDFEFNEYANLDFFKIKNEENLKKFNKHISEYYIKTKEKFERHPDPTIIECQVPNGKHFFYSMTLKKPVGEGRLEKGDYLGDILICKSPK